MRIRTTVSPQAIAIVVGWSFISLAALAAQDWTLPVAPVPYLLGGQVTVVWQHLPPFRSRYEGIHSLRSQNDDAVSDSYTAYFGLRLQPWLDLYVNPEMIRGGGVGGGFGLAGYTNGEVIRNPGIGQSPYLARAFVRATVPLGDATDSLDSGINQIAGPQPTRRLVLTAGVLATTDIFDTNRYANTTRTEFMNWSLINNVGWDFAADTRGYSRGAALEWVNDAWAARAGVFQMPTVANGETLDRDLLDSHGDQLEVEVHPAILSDHLVVLRLLAYENRAHMGTYRDALRTAAAGSAPQIESTRRRNALKYGFAMSVEQPLDATGDTGLFARLGWNDGATESFAFTEAESTVTVGAQVAGAWWRRITDRFGIAVAVNGLSAAHSDYLAAGGIGFALGDGRLRYATESILESYYLVEIWRGVAVTADYQFIGHPGYNRDRGPVSVVGLRVHLEAFGSSGT